MKPPSRGWRASCFRTRASRCTDAAGRRCCHHRLLGRGRRSNGCGLGRILCIRGNDMTQQWMDPGHPPGRLDDVVQAGFLRRWAALFLDQLILGTAYYALLIVLMVVLGIAGGMDLLS